MNHRDRDHESEVQQRTRFLQVLFGNEAGCIDLRFIRPDAETERIPVVHQSNLRENSPMEIHPHVSATFYFRIEDGTVVGVNVDAEHAVLARAKTLAGKMTDFLEQEMEGKSS